MQFFAILPDYASNAQTLEHLHYPINIIAQCARGSLACAFSLRNLEEVMAQRGIIVDPATFHRWVTRQVPVQDKALSGY